MINNLKKILLLSSAHMLPDKIKQIPSVKIEKQIKEETPGRIKFARNRGRK